jgi:hypothetical protein
VRTDICLSSIFLSWLSDESINSETGSMPGRGGRGRNIDGKKMEKRRVGIFLPSIFLP